MNRIEKLQRIWPQYKEDNAGNPVVNPAELAKLMQSFIKETTGLDVDVPPEEAMAALAKFAKDRNLKQPIFVERDKE